MIKTLSDDEIDAFIVYVRPEPRINESASTFLNGEWFVQTIGSPAEILKVKVACKWTVVQILQNFAKTKERLSISFLDFTKIAFILGIPTYDVAEVNSDNPKYIMEFEMAVVNNV